jgi:hypothetical protein
MAYFIFLKYLRSLEEFRKNPHVKISPKSPPTNFQSLGIFKNQILLRKEFSSLLAQPAQQPAGPSGLSAQPQPFFSFPTSHFAPPPSSWGLGLTAGPTHLTAQRPSSSSSAHRSSAASRLAPPPHSRRHAPLLRCKTPSSFHH